MSHLADYDAAVPMPNLEPSWYADVPVEVQRKLMAYDENTRLIKNQRTSEFIVVYRIGEAAQEYWMEWNDGKLCGWAPVANAGHTPHGVDAVIANLHRIDQWRKHGKDGRKAAAADERMRADVQAKKDAEFEADMTERMNEFVRLGQKQAVRSIPGQTCRPLELGREDEGPKKVIVYPGHPDWR